MNTLRLAWQNVLRNRRRSLVTIVIAAVGTASLLIAGGFAEYTYEALQDAAARETGHLILAHQDYFARDEETPLQFGLADYASIAAALEKDRRVRRVLPRLAFSGLVSNGDKSLIFIGQGVDVQGEMAARGVFLKLVEGSLWSEGGGTAFANSGADSGSRAGSTASGSEGGNAGSNAGGNAGGNASTYAGGSDVGSAVGDTLTGSPRVLIGRDLAKSLGVHPGSGLTLMGSTADGALNAIDVEVAGIVSTGVPEVDKRLVYAGLPTAQRLLATRKISTLSIHLDATEQTPTVLEKLRHDYPDHALQAWWEQAFYYEAVRALYNRIFGLLGLIIAALVLFSVGNTLAMAVVERTREIGTLRALGALPGEIVAQFVREGALIGGAGAAIGMVLAGATTIGLLLFDVQMPPPPGRSDGYPLMVNATPALYAITACVIVLLCVAAAWFVSRKAARKPIVEALGHV